jgi:hypothetical protein
VLGILPVVRRAARARRRCGQRCVSGCSRRGCRSSSSSGSSSSGLGRRCRGRCGAGGAVSHGSKRLGRWVEWRGGGAACAGGRGGAGGGGEHAASRQHRAGQNAGWSGPLAAFHRPHVARFSLRKLSRRATWVKLGPVSRHQAGFSVCRWAQGAACCCTPERRRVLCTSVLVRAPAQEGQAVDNGQEPGKAAPSPGKGSDGWMYSQEQGETIFNVSPNPCCLQGVHELTDHISQLYLGAT